VAARKKTVRKKASRKKSPASRARRPKGGAQLLEAIDKELSDLSKAVDKNLAPLRRQIEKAERQAGREGARMLREARKRLNEVEIKGHSDWMQFLRRSRRELSKTLTDLESAVRPKRKTAAAKKTVRRKTT
jgi:hypothetical protein